MAGQPKMRALEHALAQKGGDEYVLDQIMSGVRVKDIAAELGVSVGMLYIWREKDEERKRGWDLAMVASADTDVDDGEAILEGVASETNPAIVRAAVARSDYKRWRAERKNRQKWGDTPAQNVLNINVGDLHLQALQAMRPVPTLRGEVVE